jgi:hypothetical protein
LAAAEANIWEALWTAGPPFRYADYTSALRILDELLGNWGEKTNSRQGQARRNTVLCDLVVWVGEAFEKATGLGPTHRNRFMPFLKKVLAALPADRCGLVESARVVQYLALESAGQCGPCLNGLPRIAATLSQLASRRSAPAARDNLQRWSRLVERRGACHHPDGTVRLVRSALRVFQPALAAIS